MFKPLLFTAACLGVALLTSCEQSGAPVISGEIPVINGAGPTLAHRLSCLPKEGVLVAAHRGTSRGKGLAENAMESLEALYQRGIRVVEIDVAQLSSGEHILFHDGVWDKKSTGKGAVAQSRWRDVQKYLLKDTEGKITASRPVLLRDILIYAKGKLHLEIDFKSSADYGEVIDLIRAAGMSEQVVLIAYNERQAATLSRLAPDMFMSVSIKSDDDMGALKIGRGPKMAWTGKSGNRRLMQDLSKAGIPVLTQERGRERPYPEADIMVSDYALSKDVEEGAMGLSKTEKAAYGACLSNL